MLRSILGFLGFGRSARLARMARKAHARTLRVYGPAFGFYPVEFLHSAKGPEGIGGFIPYNVGIVESDAGNIRQDVQETTQADRDWNSVFHVFRSRRSRPAPYRAGWGIVPTFDAVPRPYPYADAFI